MMRLVSTYRSRAFHDKHLFFFVKQFNVSIGSAKAGVPSLIGRFLGMAARSAQGRQDGIASFCRSKPLRCPSKFAAYRIKTGGRRPGIAPTETKAKRVVEFGCGYVALRVWEQGLRITRQSLPRQLDRHQKTWVGVRSEYTSSVQ